MFVECLTVFLKQISLYVTLESWLHHPKHIFVFVGKIEDLKTSACVFFVLYLPYFPTHSFEILHIHYAITFFIQLTTSVFGLHMYILQSFSQKTPNDLRK